MSHKPIVKYYYLIVYILTVKVSIFHFKNVNENQIDKLYRKYISFNKTFYDQSLK